LVANGTLAVPLAEFLARCVRARASILVSGGTGSGKTTTLNALSGEIPDGERIVTIEDAAELRLRQRHVVRRESRPPNVAGRSRGRGGASRSLRSWGPSVGPARVSATGCAAAGRGGGRRARASSRRGSSVRRRERSCRAGVPGGRLRRRGSGGARIRRCLPGP